ncbi:CpsD/CapB family tyrosine-protein kinase [Alkalihalobacillus sp. LMS39]|uniref:CpsD/CapB family tyrosine-protein kinase n=1 Tax=Alkalihalobacillus sp. LMS39 TaxID=2924032 RepID=UPI001FB455CB|nr:CpsD/CapB family tyrosine-protein kinase [Alkalihalobacillus sp. LMS39]UOE93878.1 CpsD/CapB family tyrosine-protein kinase [Alkalihalobacillus sp. LMS39]
MTRNTVKPNTKQRDLITNTKKNSPISEQYRIIRTNIQFASVDKEIKTIIVTSAGPGEGKSTTSANLAVVMAQTGKKVLYIDSDLRKPTGHYTFEVLNTRGLTSLLTKQEEIVDTIQQSKIENLYILPSGPIPPNPAELLSSNAMVELLEHLKKEFDTIIIDTPPVVAVTDAQILSSKCDGTVFVASCGKTNREHAVKAKELLTKSNANILGVVVNNKKDTGDSYYYYYGE